MSASSTQTPKVEQFDLTIDDDMQDAQGGASKVLVEREQTILANKITISQQIVNRCHQQQTNHA